MFDVVLAAADGKMPLPQAAMSHVYAVILGAVVGAVMVTWLNHFYNRRLAKSNRAWERKNAILTTAEKLCDELVRDVALYWSTSANGDNIVQLQSLEGKIRAYTLFLSSFVLEYFGEDNDAEAALLEVVRVVTGGTFESQDHKPDREYINVVVDAIVTLRFAIPREIKNMPDDDYT